MFSLNLYPAYSFSSIVSFDEQKFKIIKSSYHILGDFLGGPVDKNLPCNSGDVSSIPGWGTKIPHTAEQLRSNTVKINTYIFKKLSNFCTWLVFSVP